VVHPPVQLVHYLLIQQLPQGGSANVMLLIIAIVGTTVAPWQTVKRITPRFVRYERIGLWIGIAFVVIGAAP
jgi:Mn2+/Fe2+ NRAMP family transporter